MQNRQEMEDAKRRSALIVYIAGVLLFTLIIGLIMLCQPKKVKAEEITEDQAIACILGEARGEGYPAMLGHAEAIRARGTLKGVYGFRADYRSEMPYLEKKGIVNMARKAWKESAHTHTVKNASFWASKIVDKKWIKKMRNSGFILVVTIGNTEFYRRGNASK